MGLEELLELVRMGWSLEHLRAVSRLVVSVLRAAGEASQAAERLTRALELVQLISSFRPSSSAR